MIRYPAIEPDRARLSAQRCREAKAKVTEFLHLNLTLAEAATVIADLHAQVANDLRRKTWHREARP
jgi:hypothetical protein